MYANLISASSVIILLASLSLGCGNTELESTWRDRELTIDGNAIDWEGTTVHVEDENVTVGLSNDEDFLYLFLSSNDKNIQRQLLTRGLTVWFDPDGGNDRDFGIRFPLGTGMPMMSRERMAPDREEFNEMYKKTLTELEILGPGEHDRLRTSVLGEHGISVKLGEAKENLVYELKVPLFRTVDYPHAVGSAAGETIGVGFETTQPNREIMRDRPRGRMSGGRRPGGRPAGGMKRGSMAERLELWTVVNLASRVEPQSE